MPLTTAGLDVIALATANGLGGGVPLALWFGVGDSDAPFDESQTDLQGSNKIRRAASSRVTGAQIHFSTEFEIGTGTFVPKEYGLFDAPAAGRMLCRMIVGDVGSLDPRWSWVPQLTLTVSLSP
jgi:hypothetical protein